MGLLKEKECMENSQFWYLEIFGLGAKFVQKMKSVCCVESSKKMALKVQGAYKNTF